MGETERESENATESHKVWFQPPVLLCSAHSLCDTLGADNFAYANVFLLKGNYWACFREMSWRRKWRNVEKF